MTGVDLNRQQPMVAAVFEHAVDGDNSIRAPPSRRSAADVQFAPGARRRERRDSGLATNGYDHTFV